MTLEDREHLKAIDDAPDDERRVHLILSYWLDRERMERTPKEHAVLHIGTLCGMCDRYLLERGKEIWNAPQLFDVAKQIAHDHGMAWTDPRTGEVHLPPQRSLWESDKPENK